MKLLFQTLLFTTICAVNAQVATPPQLDADLTAAAQADIISLSGVNPVNCPAIAMDQTWSGGRLILSNSPESPTARARLYQDANLPATGSSVLNRIFAYHVNNKPSGYMRFSVLIKNTSASSGTLTLQKSGTAGPSTSYGYVGKMAFKRWLDSVAGSGASVSAGQTVRLDTVFDTTNVAVGYLMHGIWDYTFTQTHSVIVCALNQNDNPITVGPTLPVAARDTHTRGTFDYCDKVYDTAAGTSIDTAAGIQQYTIGAGSDVYATGWDNAVAFPTAETDVGNYGILYRTHLAIASGDGRNLGFLINPRAGAWGGAVWAQAGLLAGGKFLIPATTILFSDNTKGAVEGRYTPGGGTTIFMQFMPTGGASFPVRVVAVPH